MVAVNGEEGGPGGRPPSDGVSNESSFFEEKDDELEADLDKPWERPSVEHAKAAGEVSRGISSLGRYTAVLPLLQDFRIPVTIRLSHSFQR